MEVDQQPSTVAGGQKVEARKSKQQRWKTRQQQRPQGALEEPPADSDEDEDEIQDEGLMDDGGDARSEAMSDASGLDGGESVAGDLGATEPDELFDPEADEQDEEWVEQRRQGRVSDAILSCPACFTTVCVDCQQHELYKDQFRAMFTMNCKVDTERLVGASSSSKGSKKRSRGKHKPDQEAAEPEIEEGACHPVSCAVCDTEVGVLDPVDELYIFYNVFPSNA